MTSFFSHDDLQRLGRILADAAQAEILPRFARLSLADARRKTSAFDVVTEADLRSEAAIAAAVRAAWPEATLIGEEATFADPSRLDLVDTADLAVIVDPLDGTRNFAWGLPLFGVIAAVTVRGEVVAGVIHDPIRQDSAFALAGGGAWLQRADGLRQPLRVADPAPVQDMAAIVGTTFLPEPLRTEVNSRLSRLATTTWFCCSAHEYRLAASGGLHGIFYNKLMPWDHAAGWLLHREAGGYGAHHDGSPYRPAHTTGGLLMAPDAASWRALRKALLED